MSDPDPVMVRQTARRYAILLTISHCILFPLFVYGALGSLWVLKSDQYSWTVAWLLVGLAFLTPISVPLSIGLIWRSYLGKRFRRVIWYGLIPIMTFETVFILIVLLKAVGVL